MSSVRLLWVAALLVLCVGVCAGGAFATVAWSVLTSPPPPQSIVLGGSVAWDQTVPAQLWVKNDGDAAWTTDWTILSVDPGNVPTLVDRWGGTSFPYDAGGGTLWNGTQFNFHLVGPPISPLSYATPVGATTAAVPGKLPCYWILGDKGVPQAVPAFGSLVTVGRFTDVLPATYDYCRAQIDQLAGLFPTVIVKGNTDGTYTPDTVVTRETMAVYLQRALGLTPPPYQGYFTDVPETDVFAGSIEALKAAGLINGTGDGTTYSPADPVLRDAMAIYVARGMVGSQTLPTAPATATFSDVDTSNWAFSAIEYCHSQGVVMGNTDGTYGCATPVTRAAMSLFVYRAFVQPNPCLIVLAGPGLSAVDPTTVAAGVSTKATDPGFAYVRVRRGAHGGGGCDG